MLVLNSDSNHVAAEVWVNDVPVAQLSGRSVAVSTVFMQQWLEPGRNFIRMEVQRPAPPVGEQVSPPVDLAALTSTGAYAWTSVTRLPPGFREGEPHGEEVAGLRWQPAAERPEPWPIRQQEVFDMPPAKPRRWTAARPIASLAAERDDLIRWCHRLRDAFAHGDTHFILSATRDGMLDMVEAHGWTELDVVVPFERMLRHLGPVAGLAPITPEDMAVRLVGGGRLVDLRRRDGSPLIKTLPDAPQRFEYAVMAGHVAGEWRLF